jgi:hypothetical protein
MSVRRRPREVDGRRAGELRSAKEEWMLDALWHTFARNMRPSGSKQLFSKLQEKPTKFTAELDDPSSTTFTPPQRSPLRLQKTGGYSFLGAWQKPYAKTNSRDFELMHDSAILLPVANRNSAGTNLVVEGIGASIQRFEEEGEREIGRF